MKHINAHITTKKLILNCMLIYHRKTTHMAHTKTNDGQNFIPIVCTTLRGKTTML